jgi:hypothetical protein
MIRERHGATASMSDLEKKADPDDAELVAGTFVQLFPESRNRLR